MLGMGRMQPGVNLYCQKVLIDQHSENILPEWLRFLKGVVDSEDLPLNISRQALQDSALVHKLRKVLTKRCIKFLNERAAEDPGKIQDLLGNLRHFHQGGYHRILNTGRNLPACSASNPRKAPGAPWSPSRSTLRE
jgi:HSP90 family molecular chaperone